MPDSLDAATSQNERWELGRIDIAKRYLPKLARQLVGKNSVLHVAKVDAAFDLIVPPLSVLVAADVMVTLASFAANIARGNRADRFSLVISASSSVVIIGHVLAGLRAVGAPRSVYRSLMRAPQLIVWKSLLWFRVMRQPDDVTWTRTTRNAGGS